MLHEREAGLGLVRTALKEAEAGAGSALLVTGGAGVGRSAFLRAAAVEARQLGFTVLQTHGSHTEQTEPLGLCRRLLASSSRGPDRGTPAPLGPDGAHRLALIESRLPEALTGQLPSGVFESLLRLLTPSEPDRPVLVLVDDVHWADPWSLRWLTRLAERAGQLPLTVLTSLCPGVDGPCPELLEELCFAQADEIRLARLGDEAAAALLRERLGRSVDDSFAAACSAATGGNPMLLSALAGELSLSGRATDAAAAEAVPGIAVESIARRTHVRVRRISPHALAVCRAVAVLDQDATPERISELTGIDSPSVTAAVTAMARMGLVVTGHPGVRIGQALLRTAVLAALPAGELRATHSRAARLLWRHRAPRNAVARHLMASLPLAEPWALDTLRAVAAEHLAAGDPVAAVGHLRRALDEPASDGLRTAILLDIGAAALRTDIDRAFGDIREALRLTPEARERLQETPGLLELLFTCGSREDTTWLAAMTADSRDAAGTGPLTARTACFALRDAGPVGPPPPATGARSADALTKACAALAAVHRGPASERQVRAARRAIVSRPDTPAELLTHLHTAQALAYQGRFSEALRLCAAALKAARNQRHRPVEAFALALRAEARLATGAVPAALDDARAAAALLRPLGADPGSGLAVHVLTRWIHVLTEAGSFEEAFSALETAGYATVQPEGYAGALVRLVRGRLRTAAGFVQEGIADLAACGRSLLSWGADNPAVAPWRSATALALAALGRAAEARRHTAEEAALAEALGNPAPLGSALTLAASLAGPPELHTAERAVTVLRASEARLALARALVVQGTLLRQDRQLPGARRVLREAADLAQEIGHQPLTEEARAELTAAGGRLRKSHRPGISGLTEAERRVIEIAATGRTNREIAKLLFVQVRTVEVHLTHAYRKLGISGRGELEQVLHPQGPASQTAPCRHDPPAPRAQPRTERYTEDFAGRSLTPRSARPQDAECGSGCRVPENRLRRG
ncbi:ATP-binding protein [Streptomyces palmae]|nr:LuxR family transcriptional regulator [Streptomyces palmae]